MRSCPHEAPYPMKSARAPKGDRDTKTNIKFSNDVHITVDIFWCDFDGVEKHVATLDPGDEVRQDTFEHHIFHARSQMSGRLLHSLEVIPPQKLEAKITPCKGMEEDVKGLDQSRWAEFDALVADPAAPCVGPSSKWSCIRHVSAEDVAKRTPAEYGFTHEESKGTPYEAGTQEDRTHDWQVKHIQNATEYHTGYVKMRMPSELYEKLHTWQRKNVDKHGKKHETIPGFFTNSHVVDMSKLDLGHFNYLEKYVVKEMKEILEWWARVHLKHTSTFGLRTYRRDSMLINHLDRKETHIVSAILQVSQETDEDGGWPVELLHPHMSGVKEVYLQPGELLLYEGARLLHGRPMRFKGESFSNVFSHFAPLTWRGLDKTWHNPHFSHEEEL